MPVDLHAVDDQVMATINEAAAGFERDVEGVLANLEGDLATLSQVKDDELRAFDTAFDPGAPEALDRWAPTEDVGGWRQQRRVIGIQRRCCGRIPPQEGLLKGTPATVDIEGRTS